MSDNYNENIAQDAGYAAGAAEGDYNRADNYVNQEEQNIGNDFSRGVQDVENAPREAVQDVENIPQDAERGVEGAASWIGDKFGGIEKEGRDAEQDVQQFDNNVDNSYNQGENEGRQQGW